MTSSSWGWNSTGHKVVALIAWEDLTPKTRQAVTALLKQHARYEKDLLLDAPANQPADDQARTAFATAATWPDIVRSVNNPMNFTCHHPTWHYIDIPYVLNDQKVNEKAVEGKGPHNAIEALTQCVADLKDPNKSDAEKAIALCWVEHLIGDIHQPLHAVSLYSKEFPEGDQGGNAEQVLREPPYTDSAAKLHTLWDAMAGNFQSEEMVRYEARGLRGDEQHTREKMADQLKVTDFMEWAKESHKLAVEDVYLDGTLKSAPARRRGENAASQPTPGVPPGYMIKAEHVAMHQVALAGYRLADQLNAIFDAK